MKNVFYQFDRNELKFKPLKYFKIFLFGLGIFLMFMGVVIGSIIGFNYTEKVTLEQEQLVVLLNDSKNKNFTKQKFYDYLVRVNIKFPKLVFAQAYKESGFKSRLFKENNNPFGMKQAGLRPNMQHGVKDGYAFYDNYEDAILDYGLYQSSIGIWKMRTEEQYLNYLKEANYYDTSHPGNKTYLDDLKYIADHIDDYLK